MSVSLEKSISQRFARHAKFNESLVDKRRDTPLALNLVPRERTHEPYGAGSSSGPVRLTPSPCASLSLDLAEDPLVAKVVPSVYNGHVIMYTKTKVMSIRERSNMSSTALPDFDLQPGLP